MYWLKLFNPLINWLESSMQIAYSRGVGQILGMYNGVFTVSVELCSVKQVLKTVK